MEPTDFDNGAGTFLKNNLAALLLVGSVVGGLLVEIGLLVALNIQLGVSVLGR